MLALAAASEIALEVMIASTRGMPPGHRCFLFSQNLPSPCGCPISATYKDWCSGQLPTANPGNDHQLIYLPGCMMYNEWDCYVTPPSEDCTGGANSCGDKIYLCNIRCDGSSTGVPSDGIQCQLTTKNAEDCKSQCFGCDGYPTP